MLELVLKDALHRGHKNGFAADIPELRTVRPASVPTPVIPVIASTLRIVGIAAPVACDIVIGMLDGARNVGMAAAATAIEAASTGGAENIATADVTGGCCG